MLGYGGHFLTKSRRYSVTFGQLRAARTDHRRAQRHPDGERDPWGRPLDETVVLVLPTIWTYAGTGYTTAPAAELAARLRRPRPRAPGPWPTLPPDHQPTRRRNRLHDQSCADDRLWTVEDLSAFLGIPVPTLYRWRRTAAGRLATGSVGICGTCARKSSPGSRTQP